MTAIKAMLTGIYPRSEALVQATRDYERGRIEEERLHQRLEADRRALFALQIKNDFDFLTDGLLNWHDEFRPLVSATSGLALGPLVRYFDTNTFYRQPVFEGAMKFDPQALEPYFRGRDSNHLWKATLPSPCCLYAMSLGREDRLGKAMDLLGQTACWLASQGCALIELQEPWLAYHSQKLEGAQKKSYAKALHEFMAQVEELTGDMRIGLHLPFGDAAPLLEALWHVPWDFMGVDCYQTDLEALSRFDWRDRALLAGCINGRNSLVEDDGVVSAFVERLLEELRPKELYLGNNVPLKFVPEPIARRKVELLGRVKSSFEKRA